jgi:hypothetical protein
MHLPSFPGIERASTYFDPCRPVEVIIVFSGPMLCESLPHYIVIVLYSYAINPALCGVDMARSH